jgi:hypothetical protein
MGTTTDNEKRVQRPLYLKPELVKRLDEIAVEQGRSFNNLMNEIVLPKFIDGYEKEDNSEKEG